MVTNMFCCSLLQASELSEELTGSEGEPYQWFMYFLAFPFKEKKIKVMDKLDV